jgi:hypothetical protein
LSHLIFDSLIVTNNLSIRIAPTIDELTFWFDMRLTRIIDTHENTIASYLKLVRQRAHIVLNILKHVSVSVQWRNTRVKHTLIYV